MYHLNCVTCHDGFPRLNAFGLAFKANNFRFPGDEKNPPLAWQKTVPVAVRVQPTSGRLSPGAIRVDYTDTTLLAGGLLTPTTAFYLHHSLWIDAKPVPFPSYELWMQQVLDQRRGIMLKVGQFELPYAYPPGSDRVTVLLPLLFLAEVQNNDTPLGGTMRGVQASGIIGNQARWYLDYGAPSLQSDGNLVGQRQFLGVFRDFFLRVSTRDPARNFGLFGYFTQPPRDPTKPSTFDRGQRYGVDAAVLWHGFQFFATAVYGENSDPTGSGKRGFLRSGFIEADHMFRPWLGLTARWDVQTIDTNGTTAYTDAKSIALRVYPLTHLQLLGEYEQLDHGQSATWLQATISF
jgi:hypothetical protein